MVLTFKNQTSTCEVVSFSGTINGRYKNWLSSLLVTSRPGRGAYSRCQGGISDVQTYEESPGVKRHMFGNHLVCRGEGEEDGLIIKYGKPKMCLMGP